MKKVGIFFIVFIFAVSLININFLIGAEKEFKDLFNGENLDGWVNVNCAPETWKVKDGTIWCTGVPIGFLRTKKEYSDYKLTFEWRWPEKAGNSGVLLHMTDEDKHWPPSMEAQLMNNRAGDLIGMAKDLTFKTYENTISRYAKKMND